MAAEFQRWPVPWSPWLVLSHLPSVLVHIAVWAYVEACNAEGACSARTSIAFRPPPPAPSGIVAVADGSTEVDLTWNSVANATRYEVEYKTTASDAWIDHPGSTTATSTSVAGLECGTGHDFRVRAHGDGTNRASHWGPWSATASEDTEACVVNRPGAPANVALTVRDRQLEVAWDTPTSDGGSPIVGHQFRYRVHGTETWTDSDEYTTASSRNRRSPSDQLDLAQRVIAGLGNGTEYDVEVRVKNANGYSSWTEHQPVSAVPAAATIAIASIVDDSLEVGGSTEFSVRAENLSTTVDYTIRLSTSATGGDSGVLKFNSCGTNAADALDFPIGTNASAVTIQGALTVYGCAAGGDDLTATLSGGTGTSPSATRAITATESAFPTLQAPIASFAADGVTVETDFILPDRRFQYRVILEILSGEGDYTAVDTHDPVFGDSAALFFTGKLPDTTDVYRVTLSVCRDATRSVCGNETTSPAMSPPDGVDIDLNRSTAGSIAIDATTDFAVSVNDLHASQSYVLSLHSNSTGTLKFGSSCTRGTSTREFDPISGAVSYRVGSVSVVGCAGGSAEIYATLKIGTVVIASSTARLNIDVKPHAPIDVRVNGDSRTANSGQAKLRWSTSSNATTYKVSYGVDCPAQNAVCNPALSDWLNGIDAVANTESVGGSDVMTLTLQSLTVDTLYRVRVAVVENGISSDWSPIVLVYPTAGMFAESATVSPEIGSIPANGYHPSHNYQAEVCTNKMPSNWLPDIKQAVSEWERKVVWNVGQANIITGTPTERDDCVDLEVFNNRPPYNTDYQWGEIRQADNLTEFKLYCHEAPMDDNVAACASKLRLNGFNSYGEHSMILFRRQAAHLYPPGGWGPGAAVDPGIVDCSQLYQTALHEAGHAFAFRHAAQDVSVMKEGRARVYCEPRPHDIAAMMAIYQSHPRP